MSDAKNIIKRLVNSTDKLRVNVTELLKLIKTKQDKLPTDGSSEEFLAKDGQYHTVKSSTQSNWEQNDENADDYIKNRPFYKKSKLYTFPNADYTTPYILSEEADLILYKIADEFVKPKTFEGSTITGHVKGEEPESIEITAESLYEERDKETGELLSAVLANAFLILYVDTPVSEKGSEIVPPGIYYGSNLSSDQSVVILDGIELILDLKQIDKEFIPSDYATVDDVEGVSNRIQIAQNTANQAQSTANNAATKANQAQSTANNAATKADQAQNTANQAQSTANNAATKADQAQSTANNAATKADQAQSTANNAYGRESSYTMFGTLSIQNASVLFYNTTFRDTPFQGISSESFARTFQNNIYLEMCNIICRTDNDGYTNSLYYDPKTIFNMFDNCLKLKIINGTLNLKDCTNERSLLRSFNRCVSLQIIGEILNIKCTISFAESPLSNKTVDKILNALVEGTDPQTLTLRSDIIEQLTDEQFAKIPSNWTIQ